MKETKAVCRLGESAGSWPCLEVEGPVCLIKGVQMGEDAQPGLSIWGDLTFIPNNTDSLT